MEFPSCSHIRVGSLLVLRLAPTGQRAAFRWFTDSKLTAGMNQDPGEHWGPLHGCVPTVGLDPSNDFMAFKVLPKRHFKLVTLNHNTKQGRQLPHFWFVGLCMVFRAMNGGEVDIFELNST